MSACAYDTLPEYLCKHRYFAFEDGILASACRVIASPIVSVSTVTRELQSYLYNRQHQLNVRKPGLICKTSALLCDLVPKYKLGEESFYYLTPVCDSAACLTEDSKRKLFICFHCLLQASDFSQDFYKI